LRENARNLYEDSEFDVGDLFPVLERLELAMGLIHFVGLCWRGVSLNLGKQRGFRKADGSALNLAWKNKL
jgi:hypothetical protein